MSIFRVFVGYDSRYPDVYEVCKRSIQKYVSVTVEPLNLQELRDQNAYWGTQSGSTEFSFTRFLVPYLTGYTGKAIYCDSDFLWTANITQIKYNINEDQGVFCVQHNLPQSLMTNMKMDGQPQVYYPRKNWSSFMVFNCSHKVCKKLTPEYVSTTDGLSLHSLDWAGNSIGNLPLLYNFLVNYYTSDVTPLGIHYTDGGPWLPQYSSCPYSNLWHDMHDYVQRNPQ